MPGRRNAIGCPRLLGLTDFNRLVRLLDRSEDYRTVFSSSGDIYWPDDFDPAHQKGEIVGILIDDTPPGHNVRVVKRIFATKWPPEAHVFPGVVLERSGGKWLIAAHIYDDVSSSK